METPRVLVLIDLFPPIVGGAETHAGDLVRGLRALDVPVTVLTRQARPDLPAEEELSSGAPVLRVPARFGGKRWAKYGVISAFREQLRLLADDIDVVYLCGFRVLGWPLAGETRRLGLPLVLRAEVLGELSGDFIWDRPGGRRHHLLRALLRPLVAMRNLRLLKAGTWLSISTAVREEYLMAGVSPDRIADIPNGIDTARFHPAGAEEKQQLRQDRNLPADGLIFVYSGKLNRGKGLGLLLEAWKQWTDDGNSGHLLLVGAGGGQFLSCEDELRAFVEKETLADRVVMIREVPACA